MNGMRTYLRLGSHLCMCGSCVFEGRFLMHCFFFFMRVFDTFFLCFVFLVCVNVAKRRCLLSNTKTHQKLMYMW